jgi:hypothetical protein
VRQGLVLETSTEHCCYLRPSKGVMLPACCLCLLSMQNMTRSSNHLRHPTMSSWCVTGPATSQMGSNVYCLSLLTYQRCVPIIRGSGPSLVNSNTSLLQKRNHPKSSRHHVENPNSMVIPNRSQLDLPSGHLLECQSSDSRCRALMRFSKPDLQNPP